MRVEFAAAETTYRRSSPLLIDKLLQYSRLEFSLQRSAACDTTTSGIGPSSFQFHAFARRRLF